MTAVDREPAEMQVGPVVWATTAAAAVATAAGALGLWAEARRTGEDNYLAGDLVAIGVFTAIGLLVVVALDIWALRGGERRVRAMVIGLAVAAVLTLPLLWWNAVPVLIATSVLALGARLAQDSMPRAARLAAVLVIAAVIALWIGSVLAEYL